MYNSALNNWQHILLLWQSGTSVVRVEIAAYFVVSLCTVITMAAVLNSFLQGKSRESVQREKKSVVETGTMTLFFGLYYMLVKNKIGVLGHSDDGWQIACILFGTILVVIGCIVNVIGRRNLGGNWGNQIRIYKDHSLVNTGTFKWVRHPLYASLIWMFYGASLVYLNAAAFAATTFIFMPFMYYRAKQEETMLIREFPEYQVYRATTGMFFPSLNSFRRKAHV